MNLTNEAASALDVAGKLLDELGVADATLRARGLLLALGNGQRDREEVANVERKRLDQDRLIPLQPIELA